MPLPICVIGDSYAMAGPKWPVFCIGELYILDRKTDAKILSVHLVNDFWMQATYLRKAPVPSFIGELLRPDDFIIATKVGPCNVTSLFFIDKVFPLYFGCWEQA